jgi:predicted membrane chloride channel (bestrophin family)
MRLTASGEYNNTEYDEYYLKNPFAIVFCFANTVWPLVLPVCLFNCLVLTLLDLAKRYWGVSLSIMPQGHALMSILLVSLGVSKVNLAYARYANAQLLKNGSCINDNESCIKTGLDSNRGVCGCRGRWIGGLDTKRVQLYS